MKKIEFNIRMFNPKSTDILTTKKKGYLFKTDDNFYGVDHRVGNYWVVSELKTGLKVCEMNRLYEVHSQITDELDKKVTERLNRINKDNYVNDIEIYK